MSEAMPLAVVAIRQVLRSTGATRNALEQAQYLRTFGYRVVILAERANRSEVERVGGEWVRIRRWPFKGFYRRYWFDWQVQRWVQRHKPELMISHGDAKTQGLLVLHNCVHLAQEYIYGTTLPKRHEVARLHDSILSQGHFQKVIVNSRLMANDLKQRYGITGDRIELFYQGVDLAQFNPDEHAKLRSSGRECMNISKQAPLIGLVTSGNFKKRNVSFLITLAAHAISMRPDWRWVVVGSEKDIQSYKKQAEELGVLECISFHKTITNVETLYHAIDVFLLPAHIEEYGRVVLEALACGTPVVVSDRVGASEIMCEHGVECVMDSWDPDVWCNALSRLLDNTSYRETVISRGLALAEAYSQERRGEAMYQLLSRFAVSENKQDAGS